MKRQDAEPCGEESGQKALRNLQPDARLNPVEDLGKTWTSEKLMRLFSLQ